MAGVPDDYQFELNDIIQEGQLQVEKYRAQVRVLEDEVEELEEERARLRRRLRENVLGGQGETNDDEDNLSRKKMKDELNRWQEKCHRLEEDYQALQERVGGGTGL
jgi:chromosome segregation ATPase